ncbi:MAG TPA: hypothetical protein VJ225_06550 [Nitrososphaeraceae archaeon]|jgi:hypothetical protein|nr:hypothetical protein [Nitrososphaeraceae archaeon]
MKVSELCKMVQDSIHSGKYPLENNQRGLANSIQIINRSSKDDLESSDIKIEVRLQDLFVLNNYVPNMQHLPGIIEIDILDSFKMLCRRLERIEKSTNESSSSTISLKK